MIKNHSQLRHSPKNQLAQNDSFGCNFVCMHLAQILNLTEYSTPFVCNYARLFCNERDLYEQKKRSEKKSSTLYVGAHKQLVNTDNIFPELFLELLFALYAFNYCEFPLTIQCILWPWPMCSVVVDAFNSLCSVFFRSFRCIQFVVFLSTFCSANFVRLYICYFYSFVFKVFIFSFGCISTVWSDGQFVVWSSPKLSLMSHYK